MPETVVLKFGSSVLRTREDLPNAIHEIYRWYRDGYRVIGVVSAIGLTTDELLCEAHQFGVTPEPYATAELLATGERASAALLGIALDRAGIPARVLNPREIGLTVTGTALDGELIQVDVSRLAAFLMQYPVLIVPGFFGTDAEGRTHVLGRGGSDLTAVFLAQALSARCRLLKDVDGVYEADPADPALTQLRRYTSLTYRDALEVAGQLIQPKAIRFLEQHRLRAEVAAMGEGFESTVYTGPTELTPRIVAEPMRVLLLGLGTVGFGVYQRLLANPEAFRIVGALVRDRVKYEKMNVPGGLIRTRVDQIQRLSADVVIDALPGAEPSTELVRHFLSCGVHVVTANKAVVAEGGEALTSIGSSSLAQLHYSATVGGGVPMVELLERVAEARIVVVTGVLNGTCNFLLDHCGHGALLSEALDEATRAGFAEADAGHDLSGEDAARKIKILAQRAFRAPVRIVEMQRLNDDIAELAHQVASDGLRLRQVTRAVRRDGEVHASVRFERTREDSVFGSLRGEWNALEIQTQEGTLHQVSGRGAGRWPTTEAILGDLFTLRRVHCASRRAQLG